MRSLIILACFCLLALVVGGCGASEDDATSSGSKDASSADSGDRECGTGSRAGAQLQVFCGDGTASATLGDTTTAFESGTVSCQSGDEYVTVNAGTLIMGDRGSLDEVPDYLGIVIGRVPVAGSGNMPDVSGGEAAPARADGTYTGGTVTMVIDGADTIVKADSVKATLTDDRSKGSLTATSFDGKPVAAEWDCA